MNTSAITPTKKYNKLSFLVSSAFVVVGAVGSVALFAPSSNAQATDPVTVIDAAVTQAESVIGALGGLSASALAIALIPLGTMLALRFLNMILSRV